MAQRVYGPIQGAGVQIIEKEGQKSIEPGALGWVAYAGVLEKGPTNTLMVLSSKLLAQKRIGGYVDYSQCPDAIFDYFDLAAGAGGVLAVRVTDGNEQPAQGYQLSNHTGNAANLFCRRSTKTVLGKVKAKNGGRWGGKAKKWSGEFALVGDLTSITLDTGLSVFTTDEWKGGRLRLDGVANSSYTIESSSAAGVITVSADQDMATDLANGGDASNYRYYLELENEDKALSFQVMDGDENPDTEFGMYFYLDGELILKYANLSVDTASSRYWVDVINNDGNNYDVEVEDLFTGSRIASVRPANYWGVSSSLTATVLTRNLVDYTVNPVASGNGNATFAIGTTADSHLEQTLTLTFTSPTAFTVSSDRFGDLGSGTAGVLFASPFDYVPPFTVTAGANPMAATDTIVVSYKPFEPDVLVDGFVYPDKATSANKKLKFRIVANDHKSITVAPGSDMTDGGGISAGEEFMVVCLTELMDGRDGYVSNMDSFIIAQAWDKDFSPFNRVEGRNLGLIKMATPGVTSTAVQKAGVSYADAKNFEYRYEFPSNIVTEDDAELYINETLGRSDYAVATFPSYAYVLDPVYGSEGRRKLATTTGMIHGREARIAVDNFGYHKAEAGVTATLPKILDLPTGEVVLNEEILNPKGIGVIKNKRGNYILWGDRTLWLDPTWKFKHHREQMSYYEHVLQENFDYIVFALNQPETRAVVQGALIRFFIPEYTKGALDRDYKFSDAAEIKVDRENNTDATKADGDMFADVSLRLVDVVERLRIRIGKQGIFEATV